MVKKLVMGNEAFAHGALAAGVRVVAGYPGTPSSEVIETIAAQRAAGLAEGVHVEWSTNEKVALELLAGASLSGARGLFTCKQMGLNVASDALLCLDYVGVKGGLVLFVADDPGPISSQTEQDTRRFAKFAKVPVLDPSTLEQGYEMMGEAFDLSEKYQTPVIVRSSTRISHASSFLEVPERTVAREAGGFERDPRWVIFPKRSFEAHGEINERLRLMAQDFSQEPYLRFNPVVEGGSPDAPPRLGILAGGVSASYVEEALSLVGQACQAKQTTLPPYRFMQVGTPYPFPEEAFAAFTEGLEAVLVLEELDHVLEDEALAFCGRRHKGFEVYGKLTGHARDRGENTVDDLRDRIAAFLGVAEAAAGNAAPFAPAPDLPLRPPVLCAGCPHRGSFYAVKRALKKLRRQAVLCGDIGCYTLGNAQPLDAVDTCLCMGAGITMAQGVSVAEGGKKQLAFVGDSTFFASGLPGIVNAAYNNHDITVVVLDNSTTAMTGAQPHPGTGKTLMGTQSEPVSIEAVLRAAGISAISHANPFLLEESIAAAVEAIGHAGPSALIYKAPCITLVRPKAPVAIDAGCTGCKKCILEIGCPAIGFDRDSDVAFINKGLCAGCGLCVQVCLFKVIVGNGEAPPAHPGALPLGNEGKAGEGNA